MELVDFMNAEAFSEVSLTHKINHIDHKPMRLGELGLFEEEGVTTTTVVIEEDNETLSLVPTGTRGKVPDPTSLDRRKVRSFAVPHVPTLGHLMADQIQNVRAYGVANRASAEMMAVEAAVNRILAKMRRRLEVTLEYHRIGALKGQILDADGASVLFNLFTEFGVAQQTFNMVLDTGTTNVLTKIRQAQRLSLVALKADVVTGWRALCGDSFFDKLVGHAKVEDKYLNYVGVETLRNELAPYSAFNFGGVAWENYRGSVTGSDGNAKEFVPTAKAYLYPLGVPDLFVTYFSPADNIATVNTMGIPFYIFREEMKMGKGVELEAQTNPLCLCTKPRAIIELNENT
jgi:hypothetical protein